MKENETVMSFSEVAEKIGTKLPESSNDPRWWGNDRTHTQAKNGWLKANCKVIWTKNGHVKFGRALRQPPKENPGSSSKSFGELAMMSMSMSLAIGLTPGRLDGCPRELPLVSEDGKVAGDLRFMKMTSGRKTPSAKHSAISEAVLFLGCTKADRLFIAFGNDRAVPESWLRKYRMVLGNRFRFYFIHASGEAEVLYDGWVKKPDTVTPPKRRVRPRLTMPRFRPRRTYQERPERSEPNRAVEWAKPPRPASEPIEPVFDVQVNGTDVQQIAVSEAIPNPKEEDVPYTDSIALGEEMSLSDVPGAEAVPDKCPAEDTKSETPAQPTPQAKVCRHDDREYLGVKAIAQGKVAEAFRCRSCQKIVSDPSTIAPCRHDWENIGVKEMHGKMTSWYKCRVCGMMQESGFWGGPPK
jgi:hypothetical protein